MSRLFPSFLHFVGVLAEGALRLLGEELSGVLPVEVHDSVVLDGHSPEVVQLFLASLTLVSETLEIADVIGAICFGSAWGISQILGIIESRGVLFQLQGLTEEGEAC